MTDQPTAPEPSTERDAARPVGWYRTIDGKQYWDGEGWNKPPAAAETGVSGLAVASMILGIIGLLVGINALFKATLFLGVVDVFGPFLLGALAIILGAIAGKRSIGMRITGFICGGLAVLLGIIIIAAIAR